jgi:hypothetical protein
MILYSLLPPSWRPYAKTAVAAVGTVLSALALTLPAVPAWVPVATNVLTALGVWGVPNATLPRSSGGQEDGEPAPG